MEIIIDAGAIKWILPLIPKILFLGGLILIVWYINRVVTRFLKNRKKAKEKKSFVCLGIDVPKNNKRGPDAVERMFAHLSAIDKKDDISLEIAGIEGEIMFFIYAPDKYRDLIEAAVYTAYPSAEVFEVEDYTKGVPENFPNDKIDVWGADLMLSNPDPYPIRTYPEFEHKMSKEFNDPLVDLLEVLGKLRMGEQVWIQFIIKPAGTTLKEKGEKLVKKLNKGDSGDDKSYFVENLIDAFLWPFKKVVDFFISIERGKEDKKDDKDPATNKKAITKIQDKISKIAFDTKISLVYIAEKQVFSKSRGVIGILGALNSFNTLDLNGFEINKNAIIKGKGLKPEKQENAQKTASIVSYKERSRVWNVESKWKRFKNNFSKITTIELGEEADKNYLNIEELATLYHFPTDDINAPLVKKTGSKRGQPPVGLPTK